MDEKRLKKHISDYIRKINSDRITFEQDRKERTERQLYYQSWTANKLETMAEEQFYEFVAKLWAMLIWGNKKYMNDNRLSLGLYLEL